MTFHVIDNPNLIARAGFTNAQFKRLDGLYLQSAAVKALTYRSVECDFDDGVVSYSYYESEGRTAYLQFIIRKVGPRTMMYEIFKAGKGRICKSGVFERAYEKLEAEIREFSEF
jgi:hypothetical protein